MSASRRARAVEKERRHAPAPAAPADVVPAGDHADRMMAHLVKADSGQLQEKPDTGFADLYAADRAVEPPLPLDGLLKLVEHNAIHSACIDAKVADTVGRGWHLEAGDDGEEGAAEGDKERVESELRKWLRSITTGAGGEETFAELCDQAMREQDTCGWGAWEIVREGATKESPIAAIFPVPAQTLRATRERDVYVQVRGEDRVYFKRFGADDDVNRETGKKDGADEKRANEVLVFKLYSARSTYYGIPKWISAAPALAELASIREFNVAFFSSGGKTDNIVHVTDKESADKAKVTADSIVQKLEEGKGSPGHTSVVTYGGEGSTVDVHPLSTLEGKRDAQFRSGREDCIKEVLIAHQVPPYRVGWAELGSLGGSAAEQMLDAYRYGTIEPPQEKFEERLAATIFNPEVGGYNLAGWEFRFVDVDWEEMAQDVAAAAQAVEAGLVTPDEGRAMIGEDPLDTDESQRLYYKGQPLGATPDESAAAAAEAATEAAVGVVREFKGALEAVVKGEAEPDPTDAEAILEPEAA